jgi:hypothetical protein
MKIEIKYFFQNYFIQWKKLEQNALKISKNEKDVKMVLKKI